MLPPFARGRWGPGAGPGAVAGAARVTPNGIDEAFLVDDERCGKISGQNGKQG